MTTLILARGWHPVKTRLRVTRKIPGSSVKEPFTHMVLLKRPLSCS